MGRPRKPVQLHLVDGTYRPKAHNPNQPVLEVDAPPEPEDFNQEELAAWRRFRDSALALRVLSRHDWAALESLARAYVAHRKLRIWLREHGYAYVNPKTKIRKAYPEARMLREEEYNLNGLLSRFGLTPSDRGKVYAKPDAPKATPEEDPDSF